MSDNYGAGPETLARALRTCGSDLAGVEAELQVSRSRIDELQRREALLTVEVERLRSAFDSAADVSGTGGITDGQLLDEAMFVLEGMERILSGGPTEPVDAGAEEGR